MRILVLGAAGMAGHVIATYLSENGHVVDTLAATNRYDNKTVLLDVTDSSKFQDFLSATNYDVIVNCIGLLIKQSEDHKDLAAYLNGYLPHFLERYYENTATKIIHLSTDCVFSGKNAPYYENSPYDGELFYDRSKALGEIINDKDLTFRMSIIGPDMQEKGIGLFNWFYAQTGELNGYRTAIWNGITTITLANAIQSAIGQNLTGLYHLVPKESISKFELLNLFKTTFKRDDISITPTNVVTLDKTLVNTRKDFDFTVPSYPAMVEEMKQWIDDHTRLYPHYERTV